MIVNDPTKSRRQAVILGIVLGILQLALVPNVGIGNGRANLALIFTAYMCMGGNSQQAPIVGFCAGLFFDLCSSGPIGLMALLLTIAGWGMSIAGQARMADDPVSSTMFFAPVAGAVSLIYCVVLMATGQVSSLLDAIVFRALPGFVLDVIAFLIVALIIARTSAPTSGYGMGSRGRGGRGGGFTMKRGL